MAEETTNEADNELVSMVEEKFRVAQSARLWFDANAYLNMAFLKGDQYSFWNPRLNQLESFNVQQTPQPKHRVRMVDNKLFPLVRKQRARFGKSKPRTFCTPINESDEAADNAKVAEDILEGLWSDQDIPRKIRETYTWVTVTGNGYIMPAYDTWQGPGVQMGEKLVPQGDLNCEVINPLEMYLPFMAGYIQDLPWIIRDRAIPLSTIRVIYGDRGATVQPETVNTSYYQNKLLSFVANIGGTGTMKDFQRLKDPDGEEDYAYVKDYFERPSFKYPLGRIISISNGKLLRESMDLIQSDTDDFLRKKPYPFIHFRDFIFPGFIYGLPSMQFAIALQKDWNKAKSQIIEYRNTMNKGKWLLPRTSGVASIDSEHAEILEYNARAGVQPQQMNLVALPPDIWRNMELTKASMEDIFAQHEVSRAEVPKNVKSGRAILALQEQDIDQTAMEHDDFEANIADLSNRMLREAKKIKWAKILRFTGPNNKIKVMRYQENLVEGDPLVCVEAGSSVTTSKFAQEDTILGRFEMGLYGDQIDPKVRKKVRKMINASQTEDVFDDDYLDEVMAESENELMQQGMVVEPQYWENHEIHIQVLNRFRKTMKFKSIGNQIRQLFEYHFQIHSQLYQRVLEAAQAMMTEEEPEKVTPIKKKTGGEK